jgi:hypothetical protein
MISLLTLGMSTSQMLYLDKYRATFQFGIKMVDAARRIQLVLTSESYLLTCKCSWILGQSTVSFMIRSISDRSTFKTKTKKLHEAQKYCHYNDSASPSPLFFYRRICSAAGQCNCLSQILQHPLPVGTFLARQAKASQLCFPHYCYRILLDQGSDPYHHHQHQR